MKRRATLFLKKKNKKENYIEERKAKDKWAKLLLESLVVKYSDDNYNKVLNCLGVSTK